MAVNQFSIFQQDALAIQKDCGLEIDERIIHAPGDRERMPDDFTWVGSFCSQPLKVAGVEETKGSHGEIEQAEVHVLEGGLLWPV